MVRVVIAPIKTQRFYSLFVTQGYMGLYAVLVIQRSFIFSVSFSSSNYIVNNIVNIIIF